MRSLIKRAIVSGLDYVLIPFVLHYLLFVVIVSRQETSLSHYLCTLWNDRTPSNNTQLSIALYNLLTKDEIMKPLLTDLPDPGIGWNVSAIRHIIQQNNHSFELCNDPVFKSQGVLAASSHRFYASIHQLRYQGMPRIFFMMMASPGITLFIVWSSLFRKEVDVNKIEALNACILLAMVLGIKTFDRRRPVSSVFKFSLISTLLFFSMMLIYNIVSPELLGPIVTGPVNEEIAFRFFLENLFSRLVRSTSMMNVFPLIDHLVSAGISGAIFSAGHNTGQLADFQRMMLSLSCSLSYHRSGSLMAPIAFHFLWNGWWMSIPRSEVSNAHKLIEKVVVNFEDFSKPFGLLLALLTLRLVIFKIERHNNERQAPPQNALRLGL